MAGVRSPFGAAMLVALLLAPMGASQPVAEPVTSCDPAECDPWKANGEVVKRGSDPVRILMYGHFREILTSAPLNTQPPDPVHERDLNAGFLMPTVDTNTPCENCNVHFTNNDISLFSSPNVVEYLEDGWRIWQQGLPGDIQIHGDTMWGFAYLSVRAVPDDAADPPVSAGVVPAIGVHMRWETGYVAGKGHTIAEGDTGTGYGHGVPDPLAGGVTLLSAPNKDAVYEFKVPMRVFRNNVTYDSSIGGDLVSVTPYQIATPNAGGTEFTQADWRFRTGPKFPARLMMDVVRPLETASSLAQRLQDPGSGARYLQLEWDAKSVFGSYDVDAETARVHVAGPSPVEPKHFKTRQSLDHDGMMKPVRFYWLASEADAPLVDGVYNVTYRVRNLQGTYELVHHQTLVVEQGILRVDPKGDPAQLEGATPGPEAGLLVALFAALSVGLRHTRRQD